MTAAGADRIRTALVGGLLPLAAIMLAAGCTGGPASGPPSPTAAPSAGASSQAGTPAQTTPASSAPATSPGTSSSPSAPSTARSSNPAVGEPTTTNTLPPPPRPTAPAPKIAGELTEADLPVPKGWRTVARPGGAEEGYRGNGSWVHGRDPRYAAQDTITIGCAPITRDDYPDPAAALEGTYGRRGQVEARPGIGLALQFDSAEDARTYFLRYTEQVDACTAESGPVQTTVIDSELGLIDQRSYADGAEWTEMARVSGDRATFVILSDPGHRITSAEAEAVLRQID